MAMPPDDRRPEWLPSGFPPRSFPPGPPASPPAAGSPAPAAPGPGRGRWLAAVAGLVALILLAAGLFAATRGGDDEGAQLATGPISTEPGTSFPTFETSTTVPPAASTASVVPVTTVPAASTTTPPGTAAAGLLEVAPATLALPRTDATAGATRGTLTLRNAGGSPLTFTLQASSDGLTAAPARGNLTAGASIAVTVTLDASRVPTEGTFSGTLSFGGTGGSRTVQVTSTTGRAPVFTDDVGEACTVPSTTCSRQIRLDTNTTQPDPSPCNTAWAYAVTITDQSQIASARADARRNLANDSTPLQQAAGTSIFISNSFSPLPRGTVLRFALEAVDVHGFTRRLPEQTVSCS